MLLINTSKNPQICKTYVLRPYEAKDIPNHVAKIWLKSKAIQEVKEVKEEILEVVEVKEVKPKKKAKSKK